MGQNSSSCSKPSSVTQNVTQPTDSTSISQPQVTQQQQVEQEQQNSVNTLPPPSQQQQQVEPPKVEQPSTTVNNNNNIGNNNANNYTYTKGKDHGAIDASIIAQHNSESSCWIVIHDKVYDVTSFLDEHPGGSDMLLDFGGISHPERNATRDFDNVKHSQVAIDELKTMLIGSCTTEM